MTDRITRAFQELQDAIAELAQKRHVLLVALERLVPSNVVPSKDGITASISIEAIAQARVAIAKAKTGH